MSINRRKFLGLTGVSGSAMFLSSMDAFATPETKFTKNANFELLFMATNWGFSGTMDEFCAKAKKEGYDGIEVWMPGDEKGRNDLLAATKKHQLLFGILYGGGDKDPQKHLTQFKDGINIAAALKPIYINCHSGKDYFTFDQNKPFIEFTSQLSKQNGIPIYHETHRGRSLFAAHITRDFLQKMPDLSLTLDISHWCAVHESLLWDMEETVSLALERTKHIHARVGHPEGPQVSDPRAPEWNDAVKKHLEWWDKIVEAKKKAGMRMTVLTEFGPPDYMWTLPYTRQPLSDQWAINVHMMNMLRKRWA
ncbi:MAG: sugar phosphate isomerase/epimerase [Chitinophagaceae bacterium]|nr:sugar phosphate isomerase/epimerase [Chitinophagaceae bacterium]